MGKKIRWNIFGQLLFYALEWRFLGTQKDFDVAAL